MARDPSAFRTLLLMAPCRRLQFNLSDLYPVPRLGIGCLSAVLKANGFPRTSIRDVIAEREWIPELLARFERAGAPDLLGISVTLLSLREAFAIAAAVRDRHPATRVVVGGPGVGNPGAGFPAGTLLRRAPAVDFFVRGEGEAPMLALVRHLAEGRGSRDDVPGLLWRDDGGQPRENPPGLPRDLDEGPGVDYAAMPHHRYRLHPPMGVFPPATMMETTRGCSFGCTFCCLSQPVRHRSPEGVEAELRSLQASLGLREVHFVDPTFTLSRSRALELAGRLGRLGLRWTCKTRVDLLDEELATALARSGCYHVAFGVESGEAPVLATFDKRATGDDAEAAFARCRSHGIRTTAYLLLASPGETEETVDRTVAWVRRLGPDYVLYDLLQADPANPLTRDAIAAGRFSDEDLERYYLSDEPSAFHHTTVGGHPMGVARRRIERASGDFYLRPRYFAQRLRDLRSVQDARNLGSGGLAFLRDRLRLGRLWDLGARSPATRSPATALP